MQLREPDRTRLHDALVALRDPANRVPLDGICGNLYLNLKDGRFYDTVVHAWLSKQFKSWEYYTGSRMFPVPMSRDDFTYESARDHFVYLFEGVTGDMWADEYGAMRLSLLEHLINVI